MNLTIVTHNVGSFSLLSQLEMSLRTIQEKVGLSEEDLDEVKARPRARGPLHRPNTLRAHGSLSFILFGCSARSRSRLWPRASAQVPPHPCARRPQHMVSSTSLKWYAITTVVSVLHSFFAYMAFKVRRRRSPDSPVQPATARAAGVDE